MGNRLSKIATRTGDAGMTGLGDGSRVEKDHLRICAMGDVDELNSQIGVLMTEEFPESIASDLSKLLLRVLEAQGILQILAARGEGRAGTGVGFLHAKLPGCDESRSMPRRSPRTSGSYFGLFA